jgi:hypothetical protein
MLPKWLKEILEILKPEITIKIGNIHIGDNITNVNIDSNQTKNSLEYNSDKKFLNINLSALSPEICKKIEPVLKNAVDVEDQPLLEQCADKLLDDFVKNENLPENKETFNFILQNIPNEDIDIWRKALYIRGCVKELKEAANEDLKKAASNKIRHAKHDVISAYGKKGNNITNLCSADYIEKWLIPLYQSLYELYPMDVNKAKESFIKIYQKITKELPFTIFVAGEMSEEKINTEVKNRLKYGMNFFNIHGIGRQNIKTITAFADGIKSGKNPILEVEKIEEEGNVVLLVVNVRTKEKLP